MTAAQSFELFRLQKKCRGGNSNSSFSIYFMEHLTNRGSQGNVPVGVSGGVDGRRQVTVKSHSTESPARLGRIGFRSKAKHGIN